MVKILSGLVAAIVIAVGGFFGFQFYTQHRIASEVEAAFEQIRAAGGKASHGKVSFDLLSRTVTIADIAAQSAAQPPVSVKIASLTASGVSQPDAARFSAESIEIADVEIGAAMGPQPALSLTYKVPRITVKDYSGPAGLQRPPASSSFTDVYRSALEQFAGVTRDIDHRPQPHRDHELRRRDAGRRRVHLCAALRCRASRTARSPARRSTGRLSRSTTQHGRQARQDHRQSRQISRCYDFDADGDGRASSIRRRPTTTSITASTGRSRPVPMSSRPGKACSMRIEG